MVEVRKKEHESIESLLRRFKRRLKQSRILIKVRKKMFYEPPKSKRKIREEARRREEIRKEKEYLRKLGKLDEKEFKRIKGR